MKYKNKILIVIPSLEKGGGAEKNAYIIGRELSKSSEVRYLNFYNKSEVYKIKQKNYNLYEESNKSFLKKIIYIFKRIIFIKKICQEYKPDLLISFGFNSNILVALTSLKRDYKVILSVRSDFSKQSFVKKLISKRLYNSMDITHIITKKMKNSLLSFGIKNPTLIYNGHDLELYQNKINDTLPINIDSDKHVFLNIGRLNYAKGQWHLLKSFSLVVKDDPESILIILGEGELRKELEGLVKLLNIENNVIMPGNTTNIFPYIKRADCFCFTSIYEGLPNVLIETLSVGTPIISTDCISGPREVICPELDVEQEIKYPYYSNCGILTTSYANIKIDLTTNINNVEEEYANTMQKMTSHQFGECNYLDIANKFSIKSTMRAWKKLIDRLI